MDSIDRAYHRWHNPSLAQEMEMLDYLSPRPNRPAVCWSRRLVRRNQAGEVPRALLRAMLRFRRDRLGALCVAWLFMLPVIPSLMESRRTFWIPLGVSGDAGLAASAIAAPLLFREIHPKVACRAGSVRRERAAGRVPHDHLPTIA